MIFYIYSAFQKYSTDWFFKAVKNLNVLFNNIISINFKDKKKNTCGIKLNVIYL